MKRTFEIRSILRFIVGNLSDLNAEQLNLIEYESLLPIDKYILNSLNSLLESVTDSYEEMNLNRVVTLIENFYLANLSSFYIKSVKDRLYCEKKDSFERKSCFVLCIGEIIGNDWSCNASFSWRSILLFFFKTKFV